MVNFLASAVTTSSGVSSPERSFPSLKFKKMKLTLAIASRKLAPRRS